MQVAESSPAVVGAGRPGTRDRATTAARPGRTAPSWRCGSTRRAALAYLATAPGELGPGPGLRQRRDRRRGRPVRRCSPRMADRDDQRPVRAPSSCRLARQLRAALGCATTSRRPPQEVTARAARLHSKLARRDQAIAHHYDVSNRFYEWVLGPVDGLHLRGLPDGVVDAGGGAGRQARAGRPEARRCEPGMRLLDVGCGWGGMVMHAAGRARREGAGRHAVAQPGRVGADSDRARAASASSPRCATATTATSPSTQFDAISSIGLTEHIGKAAAAGATSASCTRRLRPEGRLLNHCITRPRTTGEGAARPVHRPLRLPRRPAGAGRAAHREMNDAGFEVRHEENLREHYALPSRAGAANLEDALGRGGRRGRDRARPGCGGSTWPACAAGLRARQHPAAPGAGGAADRPRRLGFPVARVALMPREWKTLL